MIHEEDRSNFWRCYEIKWKQNDHDTAYFFYCRRYIEHVITKSSIQELKFKYRTLDIVQYEV